MGQRQGEESGRAEPSGTKVPGDLSAYEWRNRLLLIFAADAEDVGYKTQMAELDGQEDGIGDRDLVVFSILQDGPSMAGERELDEDDAEALRARFEVEPDTFMVVLAGKDGRAKLQRDYPIPIRDIFDLIDSMPMRQQEMREHE